MGLRSRCLAAFKHKKIMAIDTETTGLNPWGERHEDGTYPARPFAVSWCDQDGETGYVRWEVDPETRRVIYEDGPAKVAIVNQLLTDPETIKVFHNSGFDVNQFKCAGFEAIKGWIFDTKDMAHVATRGGEMSYGLKPLCDKFFEFSQEDQKDLLDSVKDARRDAKARGWAIAERGKFGKQPVMADYWLGDPELCERYAVQDAERTQLLFQFLRDIILKDKGMKRTIVRETLLYMGPIRSMEQSGVQVLPKYVYKLEKFYQSYMDKQKEVLAKEGYPDVNPRSPKQLAQIFIEDRGLEPLRKTPKGNPKMDGEFLQHYTDKGDKVASALLEYKNAAMAISGFLTQYQNYWAKEGDIYVLHPSIRQTGAITGRMSSSDPNLMNVASETTGRKRSKIGMRPRETMGPRPGHVWYLPDYSQIEVWLFACLSGNEPMQKALLSGVDFHGWVAQNVWGNASDFEERRPYYRKCAKLVMFCKLYGGGIGKLAMLLHCEYKEALEFNAEYEQKLTGIAEFIEKMSRRASLKGYIENPFGRSYMIDPGFEYRAVNYLIQGTAADVLKEALIYTHHMLAKRWKGCRILLSLHDEIMIEVPRPMHSKKLMRETIREMQRAAEPLGLPIPLPVGVKIAAVHNAAVS